MRRHLYLYLAIACFLGIIAIFVFRGYMGVYDTIRITAGENEQTIEPDSWYRNRFSPSAGTVWPGRISVSYQLDNRRFSPYSATTRASIWQENQKIMELFSQSQTVEPFGRATAEWTVDSGLLETRGYSAGQFTMRIEHDGVERRVLLYFSALTPPEKARPVPMPPPPPSRG